MKTSRSLGLAVTIVLLSAGNAAADCVDECNSTYDSLDGTCDTIRDDEETYCAYLLDKGSVTDDQYVDCVFKAGERRDLSDNDSSRNRQWCLDSCSSNGTSYFFEEPMTLDHEGEAATLSGSAVASSCTECGGGRKVRYLGNGSSNFVTFSDVDVPTAGTYRLDIYYLVDGTRAFFVSVNGGTGKPVALTSDSWALPSMASIKVTLNAGRNTIKLYNNKEKAPDLDGIVVGSRSYGNVTYQGEAAANTFKGSAVAAGGCSLCSGGSRVRYLGNGASNSVTVNNVNVATSGTYEMKIHYLLNGSRSFKVSVNGGTPIVVPLSGTSWSTPVTAPLMVPLKAGFNAIKFFNDTAKAPDLDRIVID